MKHEDLTEKIIGVFYTVYNELGHGFLESVYEQAMAIALREAGFHVVQQAPISVHFRGQTIGEFRADLLIEDKVIVELKAARAIEKAHEAQVMNYLRATKIEVGLLMNFGPRPEFKRFIFDNDRKMSRGLTRMNTDQKGGQLREVMQGSCAVPGELTSTRTVEDVQREAEGVLAERQRPSPKWS